MPPALAAQFRFDAGQHLTVRAKIDGQDVRRSYSICSPVHEGKLRIAVKRSPGGVFSTWANDSLAAGASLDVTPPMGHFGVAPDPARARHYVGFAAGSGITPLVSIIATTLASEPTSEFTLFYGNRASGTVMFREALAALKDIYLARFNLVHVLSREAQDIPLLHGRIDREKADALLAHWIDLDRADAVYLCGPDGMMHSVAEALAARGYPESKVRIERFAASIPKHEHKPGKPPEPGHTECEVTVVLDGATRTFMLEKGKESILEAGLRRGIELPYSCKGGVCSTCARSSSRGRPTWTPTSRWRTTRSRAASCSLARAIPRRTRLPSITIRRADSRRRRSAENAASAVRHSQRRGRPRPRAEE